MNYKVKLLTSLAVMLRSSAFAMTMFAVTIVASTALNTHTKAREK